MNVSFVKENLWEFIKSTLYLLLGYGLMINSLVTEMISTKRGSTIYLESSPELFWFGVAVFIFMGSYGLWKIIKLFSICTKTSLD